MTGIWMIGVLLLWFVPGVCWLWERGAFDGFSRRASNRKLALFVPFFLLLLTYAQKPQNQPQLTLPSGQQLVVVNTPAMQMSQQSGELMSAELKLSGVVPVVFTNSVWSGWTNGTVYEPWVTVPVRKGVAELELPFAFPVGTNVYSNIYVSASGVIGFDRPRGSVVPAALPCTYGTNGVFLALAWGDNMFKPGQGSRLYYGIESNSFCVLLDDVFAGTNVFSAKAELFDNGTIVLKYRDLPADHTIGLQNFSGGWQVATNGTFELFCRYFGWADPEKIDTDDDGLSDYDEVYVYGTDPRTSDTDGDGLSDADEIALGYNPTNADSNGDGFSDLLDSQGVSSTSDPLVISRVLDGYAVDDASYVPTAVISNDAVLVTTRLDLPEGAAPVGAMVNVAGKMIPILNGVTFSHVVAVAPDSENLIEYVPSNLPAGSSVTIEIGAHRFAELDDPNGIVTRFYSIYPEEGASAGMSTFGLLSSPMPTPAGSGTAVLNLPTMKIEPETVCVHATSGKAEVAMERRAAYDYSWTVAPFGAITVDGGFEVQVAPGFKRSETGTLSVRAVPKFRQAAGEYQRSASAPLRFCPNEDEEERLPGDGDYTVDPEYHNCPNHCVCHSTDICPVHNCYYSMCPKDDFEGGHAAFPVVTNYVEGAVLQMDELKRYRTIPVSVPAPATNCCPCPEHTGVYTWILPNWRVRAYDSPQLINEIDRQDSQNGYVYVIGVEPSKKIDDAHLMIAPRTGDVVVHQFTVLGLQLQPDFDGDGTVTSAEFEKRKNGETWKVQVGTNLWHKIVFQTDVLLPFGMIKVSLQGAPAGTRLFDTEEEICSAETNFTDRLSVWHPEGDPSGRELYLECPKSGSGEIVFEFMAVDGGKSYRCERRQAFTAYETILEPISGERDGGYVINPAGMPSGESAHFRCWTTPAIDGNRIKWAVKTGNASIANPVGTNVSVSGNGAFELEVEIEGIALKEKPTISSTGFQKTTTPVTVWVVRESDGSNPAISESDVNALFPEVNKIFHQAGMSFYLSGPIRYTNRTEWLSIQLVNREAIGGLPLLDLPPNVTNGVELYFVDRIANLNSAQWKQWAGFNGDAGIALACPDGTPPTTKAVAHEIGHACGLDDIYYMLDNIPLSSVPVSQEHCPDDFGNYDSTLMLPDLVQRLLMCADAGSGGGTVIPRGQVAGLVLSPQNVYSIGNANVGQNTPINRHPSHQ